jgi:hypothetical protein
LSAKPALQPEDADYIRRSQGKLAELIVPAGGDAQIVIEAGATDDRLRIEEAVPVTDQVPPKALASGVVLPPNPNAPKILADYRDHSISRRAIWRAARSHIVLYGAVVGTRASFKDTDYGDCANEELNDPLPYHRYPPPPWLCLTSARVRGD